MAQRDWPAWCQLGASLACASQPSLKWSLGGCGWCGGAFDKTTCRRILKMLPPPFTSSAPIARPSSRPTHKLQTSEPFVSITCKIEALRRQLYHRPRLSVIQKASGSVAVRLLCGLQGSKAANSRLPNVILYMHKATGALCMRSTSSFILVCAPHAVHTHSHTVRHTQATNLPTQKVTGNCSDGVPVSQKASGGRSTSSAHTVTVRLLASVCILPSAPA